ncbi:hypothetical protein HY045_01400 [Candidatus Woesebacteria bacterium]|nr:hypothetical protein [Candidatus Woesebacteria bacterium]
MSERLKFNLNFSTPEEIPEPTTAQELVENSGILNGGGIDVQLVKDTAIYIVRCPYWREGANERLLHSKAREILGDLGTNLPVIIGSGICEAYSKFSSTEEMRSV